MKTQAAKTIVLSGLIALAATSAWSAPAAQAPGTAAQPQASEPAAAVKFVEVAATADTIRRLQSGGYALYLRHGLTNNAIADRLPTVDLNDCSTQRPLTEAGRQMLAKVGESMRKARIPVGELKVSPMCRARQSAAAAFPQLAPAVDNNLMYTSNLTAAEKAPIIATTRKLLSTPVSGASNRLVLAHAPNLMDLMGYFPKEGTLVVLYPKGEKEGFDYVASIPADRWDDLLHLIRK